MAARYSFTQLRACVMSLPRSCMTSRLQMRCRVLWPFTLPSGSLPVALATGWCGPSAWWPPICWWSTSKCLQWELHPCKGYSNICAVGEVLSLGLSPHVPAEWLSSRDSLCTLDFHHSKPWHTKLGGLWGGDFPADSRKGAVLEIS